MSTLRKNWLRVVAHFGASIPFLLLVWDGFTNNLTANPIQAITQRTGLTGLILLVLSLAVTPINTVFGWKQVVPLRRPLGLWTFWYASLHFLTFTVLDYVLDPALIWEAIFEKPYALVGFTAFLLMAPLALTSTKGWMKRLGKRWKALHKLIYVAAPLVIVHFVWVVKADTREPLLYGSIIALLLALRIPPVRRFFTQWRNRRQHSVATRTEST
jgi:methionine sulfoxide reductase heme-binding subunit